MQEWSFQCWLYSKRSQTVFLTRSAHSLFLMFICLSSSLVANGDSSPCCPQAYSQDVCMKGDESHSSKGQNFPEPPPLHYPSKKPGSASSQPSHNVHSPLDNWQCRTSPTTSPLDNRPPTASTPPLHWPRGPEDPGVPPLAGRRGRSSSAVSALDFHFANHNAAISSATLPPPRRAPACAHASSLCHQALSDWYYSQAQDGECVMPQHRSISQDHLADLGLAVSPRPAATSVAFLEQRRREAVLHHHQAAAASHNSYWFGNWDSGSGSGKRSCSETLLAAYAEYEHNYGRSVETLAQASALVAPQPEQSSQSSHTIKITSGEHQHQHAVKSSSAAPPADRQCGQQVAEPQTRRVKEGEQVGYKSYSPSFSRKAGHLPQAHSFREPSYSGPHLDWRPSSRSSPSQSDGGIDRQSKSNPPSSVSEQKRVRLGEDREVIAPVSLTQEVVLRQKPPADCLIHTVQHPRYSTPVESPASPPPAPAETTQRPRSSMAQHAFDSLSSIPFIG